jgi:acetylornithine deacetylase
VVDVEDVDRPSRFLDAVHDPAPPRPDHHLRAGCRSALLLCADLDTVGTEGMTGPCAPKIHNGRMYGRGGYEVKGGSPP